MSTPGHGAVRTIAALALALACCACAAHTSAAAGTPETPHRFEAAGALAPRDSLAAIETPVRADSFERGFDSLDVARARLTEILSRREFASGRGESTFERWLREAGEAMGRFFRWLLGPLARVPGIGKWFAWGVLGMALVVVVAMLVRAARIEPPLARPVPRETDVPAPSGAWLARAREAAARGEFRDAVHHAYWTAAARLAESGLVPFDRARTHREVLRRVPAASAARDPLAGLVANYERVWFGRLGAGPEAWADAERRLEELGCSSEATASS